jgi:pyruvate,water dikinase
MPRRSSSLEHSRRAILLTPTLSPALARLTGRVSAVLAAAGSRAGHFASVARESGLPVLVFGPEIFSVIENGLEITVDADSGIVLPGRADELLARAAKPGPGRLTPVARRLETLNPWWPA